MWAQNRRWGEPDAPEIPGAFFGRLIVIGLSAIGLSIGARASAGSQFRMTIGWSLAGTPRHDASSPKMCVRPTGPHGDCRASRFEVGDRHVPAPEPAAGGSDAEHTVNSRLVPRFGSDRLLFAGTVLAAVSGIVAAAAAGPVGAVYGGWRHPCSYSPRPPDSSSPTPSRARSATFPSGRALCPRWLAPCSTAAESSDRDSWAPSPTARPGPWVGSSRWPASGASPAQKACPRRPGLRLPSLRTRRVLQMRKLLEGKTAIIRGASKGIGRATGALGHRFYRAIPPETGASVGLSP
jgi:hypothetical protein